MDISPSIESSLFLSPTAVVPLGLCAHSVSFEQSKQQARAILHAQHTHTDKASTPEPSYFHTFPVE